MPFDQNLRALKRLSVMKVHLKSMIFKDIYFFMFNIKFQCKLERDNVLKLAHLNFLRVLPFHTRKY